MVGFLKKLFGGGDAKIADPADAAPNEIYKGVEIRANPSKEDGGQWRIGGTLSKQIDGELVTRRFIRADLVQSQDEAIVSSVNKAKLIIEQNGDGLFKGDENRPV